MSSETSDKVIIIGGGLGGLALAQILHANKIPFEIFERDAEPFARGQGWAVALYECLPALKELLPPQVAKDLYTNSVNRHTGESDSISFVNALTGERIAQIGGAPLGSAGSILRVSREEFRKYLWTRESLPVSSGKHFSHYEEDDQGVTAYFEDGSSARGKLLIAADGLHSRVLDQFIGTSHHSPVLSQYVPIIGVVDLPRSLFEPIQQLGTAVILAAASGVRVQIGLLDTDKDLTKASVFWTLALARANPKELSDWVHDAAQEDLYNFVLETIKPLHPTIKDPIKFGGAKTLVKPQVKFMEFVPPDALPAGRVTILGDAAHAMIPFRGAGANTAILDACDLARLLIKSYQDNKDPASVLEAYHSVMLPRGQSNVLSSREAGAEPEDPNENIAKTWATKFSRP